MRNLFGKTFMLAAAFLAGLKLSAQPLITSVTPNSASAGETVTISGTGFAPSPGSNIVFFGAVKSEVITASTTSLSLKVPAGATYEPVNVTTNGKVAFSPMPFHLLFNDGVTITSGAFEAQVDLKTHILPNAVVLSDLDGDGRTDIITSSNQSIEGSPSSLCVLHNTSSIHALSFAGKQEISTNSMAYTLAAADLNGDGKPELITTSIATSTVRIFTNTSSAGSISFSDAIEYPTGSNAYRIAVSDLDLDGRPDIALVNYLSNTLSVYRNNTSGSAISFQSKIDFSTGLLPGDVAIADLNGDNKPDIAVANELGKSVSIFRNTSNTGTISFATKLECNVGNNTPRVALADLDNDGKTDIIAVNGSALISVFKNNSTGGTLAFGTQQNFSAGEDPLALTASDINGDGRMDIVIAGTTTKVLENTTGSSISFGAETNLSVYPKSLRMTAGDLDGDGKPDLVGHDFTGDRVMILRNRINEPLINSFSPAVAASGATITISGVNLNTVNSVVIGNSPAASFSLVNAGTITAVVGSATSGNIVVTNPHGSALRSGYVFPGPPVLQSFTPAVSTTSGVITITGSNLIGASEVKMGGVKAAAFRVISPDTIKALVGDGASGSISVTNDYGNASRPGYIYTFPPHLISFSPESGAVGTIVSITGENFSTEANALKVYFGTVEAMVLSVTPTLIQVTAPAGAGFAPIRISSGKDAFIMETVKPFSITFDGNNAIGNRTFSKLLAFNKGFSQQGAFDEDSRLLVMDFDGDGKPDVLTPGRDSYRHSLAIFRNISAGHNLELAAPQLFSETSIFIDAFGDLDGDGKPDLLGWMDGDELRVCRNTSSPGNFSFELHEVDTPINNVRVLSDVSVTDVDGDGKPDIVLNKIDHLGVLRNKTIGQELAFDNEVDVGVSGRGLYIGDLDGDGKPDIVTHIDYYDDNIWIFRNTSAIGNISFAPPLKIRVGAYLAGISVIDFDKDGKLDLLVTDDYTNKLRFYRNTSVGSVLSFAGSDLTDVGHLAGAFPVDCNGDGTAEVVVRTQKGLSIQQAGSSSISLPVPSEVDIYGFKQYASADLNMDGRQDIMMLSKDSMFVYLNNSGKADTTSVCTGSAVSIESDIEGTGYQWQKNNGAGFNDLTDNANYSGIKTKTLTFTNASADLNGSIFRCLVNGNMEGGAVQLKVSPATLSAKALIAAQKDTICRDENLTFTSQLENAGSSPVYKWLVNGTQSGSGTPSFTTSTLNDGDSVSLMLISNAACVVDSVVQSNIVGITVFSIQKPVAVINGKQITISNIDTTISYSWQVKSGSAYTETGSSGIVYTAGSNGVYRVTASRGDCLAYSGDLTINAADLIIQEGVAYGPNPATNFLRIDSLKAEDGWVTLEIRGTNGSPQLNIYKIENQSTVVIYIQALKRGMYFATLRRRNGPPTSFKFMKL